MNSKKNLRVFGKIAKKKEIVRNCRKFKVNVSVINWLFEF